MKKLKKGFTLVELVIVIAVIAVLAAVLIPTFSGIVQKARVSNDTTLVKSLNTTMATTDVTGAPKTMSEVVELIAEDGVAVSKLTATANNHNIVYDMENNRFALLDGNNKVAYQDPAKEVNTEKLYNLWTVVQPNSQIPTNGKFSFYLAGENRTGEINLKGVGVDVGNNTGITKINYTKAQFEGRDVIIRAFGNELNVNASTDSIDFYGETKDLTITSVAPNSFHAFGKIGYATIADGNFVAETGADVKAVVATTENAKVQGTSETIGAVYVKDNAAATINVPGLTPTSKTADELVTVKADAEAQFDAVLTVDGTYYLSMSAAWPVVIPAYGTGYAVTGTHNVVLLKDVTDNGFKAENANITIDLNGHTWNVLGTVGSEGTTTNGFQLMKSSTVTFKNGTLTSSTAKLLIQNYSNLTLEDMILDGTKLAKDDAYTLSNNNGNVVIKDTTINAKDTGAAFDVCNWLSHGYPTVSVTVSGNSAIVGNIEVSGDGTFDPDVNTFSLSLLSGDFSQATLVMSGTRANDATITKASTVTLDAPEGYQWENNTKLTKNA